MAEHPKTGKVTFREGNYFLEAEGKHHAIPVGANVQTPQLKELVGKQVEILYSEPKSFVVGLVPVGATSRPPRIICYFPADPWAVGVVEEGARAALAQQFLNEGVLSKETFEKLGGERQ
ncbi:MAG TPA: hypothetical protein VMT20_03885 [Terriglobia bacterium]|nr:hypothetical protein [Terriglobia bacterium]